MIAERVPASVVVVAVIVFVVVVIVLVVAVFDVVASTHHVGSHGRRVVIADRVPASVHLIPVRF